MGMVQGGGGGGGGGTMGSTTANFSVSQGFNMTTAGTPTAF